MSQLAFECDLGSVEEQHRHPQLSLYVGENMMTCPPGRAGHREGWPIADAMHSSGVAKDVPRFDPCVLFKQP